MSQQLIELKISQIIAGLSEEVLEYTPAAGKKVRVFSFITGGENNGNNVFKIFWKYNLSPPDMIWCLGSSDKMLFNYQIPDAEINGTNKFALVADNAGASSVVVSGYVLLEVYD